MKNLNLNIVVGFVAALVVAVLAGPVFGLIAGSDKDFLFLIIGAILGLGAGVAGSKGAGGQ